MKKQDLKNCGLPDSPGVYFFRNQEGEILYIGKATSLSDRVKSYFSKDLISARGLRLVSMVILAYSVTFEKTDSELEALLLENRLIKKFNPPYNTKEKDNKSFACVVITKENFPRVLTMRIRDYEKKFSKKDVQAVYGPFASMSQINEACKIIRKMFPYRDKCVPSEDLLKLGELGHPKPCFNAQIKLCPGVCVGAISKGEYKKNILNIKKLFEGRKGDIKKSLEKEMKSFAKKEQFEKASIVRNTIFALDHIKDTNLIKNEEVISFKDMSAHAGKNFRIEAYDVAHISGSNRVGVMVVIEGREKMKDQYRKFKLTDGSSAKGGPAEGWDDYAGLREILKRRLNHKEWAMPDLIVVDGGIAHKQTAEKILASHSILVPCVSVVKDVRHKPKDILGDKVQIDFHRKEILLANNEAHRFAISYHKKLREKFI